MIYKTDVLKELVLPNINNTDHRILIDRACYGVSKSFYLSLEIINHKWSILESKNIYQLIHHKQTVDKIELSGQEIITIKTTDNEVIKCLTVNCEGSFLSYEKYYLSNTSFIDIGSLPANTIQYEFMMLVSKKHCSIYKDKNRVFIRDYSSNGTFVNDCRVIGVTELRFGDRINIFGLNIICFDSILAVGSHIGKFRIANELEKYISVDNILDNAPVVQYRNEEKFNRSPRIISEICREQVTIEPPTVPQFSKKRSLLNIIGPSFTMAIPMLLGCGIAILSTVMSGSHASAFMFTGIITSIGSALFGALWAYLNLKETKKREADDEAERFNIYGNYLIETAEYLKTKYKQNFEALHSMYPSSADCSRYNKTYPELWNRNLSHEDFLFCRLGTGDVDFQVDIQIPKEKFSTTYDLLKDKPAVIYNNFRTLKNVPVGIDLRKVNLFGIVGGKNKSGAADIINNIIVQIAANICYTDVKIAFCFIKNDIKNKKQWDYIKWLPHIWSENKQMRYFATNRQECADVFFELTNILRSRTDNNEQYGKKTFHKPHYILFLSDAGLLDGELLGKYVFDKESNIGITTFIMTDYCRNLPNMCENIIQNDEQFCGFYNVTNKNNDVCRVKFDNVPSKRLLTFSKNISGITVREMEDDNSIVSSLDFFDMYKAHSIEDFNILEQWRKNRTYNSMKALIGKKAGGADCFLDIHEKYHGPHGLIAGTTGSGKSEIIQTIILSLAINYSPDDISFFIIDFKGGGMANLFSDLPHMAGQISNLSGNQIHRAMISIKSENLRRQKIFNEYGVNNINNYTRLYKSGEADLPISHLVIVIDEFAELKKEKPDFMREIISVAQVGRSLGVHLILATQKPSGTVDDNIWSNAKFRLCLRVQDRQDSNDMLHKPDAAYITQAGRCYLQVGNDEIYELFQSGWSGAVYDENINSSNQNIATMITPTGKTAIVGNHTKKKCKEKEKYEWYTFLFNQINNLKSDDNIFVNSNANQSNNEDYLLKKIIEKARENGYNIGFSNAEINAVKNFAQLISNNSMCAEDMIDSIINTAALNNINLPELKEKTQLEVIVEYIKKLALDNGYTAKARLWMPLLKTEILLEDIVDKNNLFNENGWKTFMNWSLEAVVGTYDDPQNQAQLPFSIDFANDGHLAVCGSVVTGKSTFIQTLIFSLALKYSPDYVNFYILDFSSGMLSVFDAMPHTGGVLRENDTDKIDKLFNMISSIINERKKLFRGGNYKQYIKVNGVRLPSLIIVIDNFAGFKEKTNNAYEDILIHISREGVGYGIYLVVSSAGFGMAEIQNRIGDNIRNVVSLEMGDKFKYMDILRITHVDVVPESDIKGRGISVIDGRLLEFQTAVAVKADDDYKRNSQIESIINFMRKEWKGTSAKPVPFIPENPNMEEFIAKDDYNLCLSQRHLLPFAYNSDDASVHCANLKNTYCYSISGKRRTGKTNLLKLLMYAAGKKCGDIAVIEKETNELISFSKLVNARYIEDDKSIFEYFKSITDTFISRNKLKHKCEENGMSDDEIFEKISESKPIFIFISDLVSFVNSIYHPLGDISDMSKFFENIIEKGYLHNIYFFACINTDEVSSVSGYKVYQLFTAYKTGVHLGGYVASQRIFNFQNLHYSIMSGLMKKGIGLTPSDDDESLAKNIVIPLVGGKMP